MANDKDFKVKNGVKPTRYVEGLGTITAGTDGPSGLFSTTLYEGTAATQTITNGINLSSDGGLVWTKNRDGTDEPTIMDTVTGTGFYGNTNSNNQYGGTSNAYITAFNTNGYTLGAANQINRSGNSFVSWTWKKTANFFDVVSYTGNGANNRAISHSLGEEPGMIICKRTSSNGNWGVYHRGRGNSLGLRLDSTGVAGAMSINNETINSSSFGVSTGGYALDNNNGDNYIAYLFGHNSSTVHCGTYTGDGSDTNREINVGFKPQWLMIKNTTTAYNWIIIDSVRGEGQTPPTSNVLFANATNAEDPAGDRLFFSDNGFTLSTSSSDYNKSGDTFVYVAIAETKNTDTLDLSTGSVFNYTPTASKTLKIGSPAASGTNSGATLLVNGNDAAGITGNFSTTIYTGTGSSQDVTTGVDLSGSNEGLVWIKKRGSGSSYDHNLFDTVRGATKWLKSNDTDAEGTRSTGLSAFNSNGFTEGGSGWTGENGKNFVAWTWKSTSKFFDIVTYTGNGTARAISHNLGSVPGMVVFKNRSSTYGWQVYHRGMAVNRRLEWDDAGSGSSSVGWWDQTTPVTSSVLNIGTDAHVNNNGHNYVAYLFGHDTSSGPIQCGSYTGNGSSTGPTITLGWQPQWLMIKSASDTNQDWYIIDTVRGFVSGGNDALLRANTTTNEATGVARVSPLSTGFQIATSDASFNQNNASYIYVAIRAQDIPSTTYDSSIKFSGGTAPASPAVGETDVITLDTTDGGTNYYASLAIDGAK